MSETATIEKPVAETAKQSDKQSKPWLFKPGQSGNPNGRPLKSRNKLQSNFFRALADDFEVNGVEAIQKARSEDPLGYVKVVASLMPKEFEIKTPLDEVTDEQLDAAAIAIRAILNAQAGGDGASGESAQQPSEVLQPVPEAG